MIKKQTVDIIGTNITLTRMQIEKAYEDLNSPLLTPGAVVHTSATRYMVLGPYFQGRLAEQHNAGKRVPNAVFLVDLDNGEMHWDTQDYWLAQAVRIESHVPKG